VIDFSRNSCFNEGELNSRFVCWKKGAALTDEDEDVINAQVDRIDDLKQLKIMLNISIPWWRVLV